MTHRPTATMADRIDFALQAERQALTLRRFSELGPFMTFDLSRCPERHRPLVLAHLDGLQVMREQRRQDGILAETQSIIGAKRGPRSDVKLGDLIRELTPAELAERDRATHRLSGKLYEELRPGEKHALMLDDRERYLAMRRDWEARGKPLAGEKRPVDLIGALKEAAKLCGIDWNAPPAPRRQLEVVQ